MSKVVLITGCSSGLGLAAARFLSEIGHAVIPTVRKKSDLELLPNMRQLDVTWPQSKIDAAIREIQKQYGPIEVLINNAGYGQLGQVEDLTEADVREQFEVNFFGSFKMIKSVLPEMKLRQSGLIINVSSIVGLFAIKKHGAYCASKFALEGLSQSLRLEEAANFIKVVVINPGVFHTDFREKAKIVTPGSALKPSGEDPLVFARLVERIIRAKKPHDSYVTGRESLAVNLLFALPQALRSRLLSLYLR